MSFSEYNGSKSKVSHAVGRILRNAQETLPKMPSSHGTSSAFTSFFKTISNTVTHNSGTERLNKSTFSAPISKFGFQKLRIGSSDKKRGTNHHAELLDNQDQEQDDSEDDDEGSGRRGRLMQLRNKSLLSNPSQPPLNTQQKQKKWRF